MEFDPVWLLLGLPVAFGLGWLASRLDLRQLRTENRSAPKAYFKGLNHLLNEQQDQAIDAFIEAVQKDPETAELHFALGNLFRRRGEYERAIRVHEHLLARADLSSSERTRAQYELALDFLKAGLLDHAETALRKVDMEPLASQARHALLGIYERSRDWPHADQAAQELQSRQPQEDLSRRRSHFLCEMAVEATKEQDIPRAHALLEKAISIAPDAPRPRLQLVALVHEGQPDRAFALLGETLDLLPAFAPLLAPAYAQLAMATSHAAQARDRLAALQQQSPSIDLVEALTALDLHMDSLTDTAGLYLSHLQQQPSLIAATRWLDQKKLAGDPHQDLIDRALQHAIRPLARYRCAACGFEAQQHYWHCPGCQSWDSYPPRRVEEL